MAIYLVPTPRWRDHKASGTKSARVIRVISAAKPDKNSDKIIRDHFRRESFVSPIMLFVRRGVCVSGCSLPGLNYRIDELWGGGLPRRNLLSADIIPHEEEYAFNIGGNKLKAATGPVCSIWLDQHPLGTGHNNQSFFSGNRITSEPE